MTTSRRHHHRCSPTKDPLDDDDLLAEILLRLPPQPSSLPHASLVCKWWRGLVSDPRFRRSFRLHHRRNPPLLGFFGRDNALSFVPTLEAPNRVPPGRFSLQRGYGDRFVSLGCRHGLVLIFNVPRNQVLVWDPVTGDQRRLAIPPEVATYAEMATTNGAVLHAAGDVQKFQVVLVVAEVEDEEHKRAVACIYSSETGLWGDPTSAPLPSGHDPTLIRHSAVLAEHSLYWMLASMLLENFVGILEFDLEKHSLAVIQVPVHMLEQSQHRFSIMRAEGDGLGLLFYKDRGFQLWKRVTDYNGVASWGLGRTIGLDKLSVNLEGNDIMILGFADENNVVFVCTRDIRFMVHLESSQCQKLMGTYSHYHHPFESVYTAGNSMPSILLVTKSS
ncbi:hypothetical protein CFC21_010443 [Triticum aestivum]|uniref:F-box domain-containing protein n=2 Tax=Triticum aestivum TaxID=4565 RepID=A0A3B6UBM6_WHEAT|nr:hypothetical protein CFC21_010443 [Triticum aestivum]